MIRRMMSVMAVLLGCAVAQAADDVLIVGDAAPSLTVKEFIKGKPIKDFKKGKIYVVEFWATWCPPCRDSIPHITELQKKYKKVAFIGVNVWEQDQQTAIDFVKEMGDKMDYRVALDDLSNPDHSKGMMSDTWMAASGSDGIPTAFIINGDGKIAWTGHPMEMEESLKKIIEGSWDLEAAIKESEGKLSPERKLQRKLASAKNSGDPKKLLAAVEKIISDDPEQEAKVGHLKLQALASQADGMDKAVKYGKHLLEKVLQDNAEGLHAFAKSIVEPKTKIKANPELNKLGLQAAKKADESASGEDVAIATTLARAYFVNGDAAKAVEAQQRAIKMDEESEKPNPDLKKLLKKYKKAAGKKK